MKPKYCCFLVLFMAFHFSAPAQYKSLNFIKNITSDSELPQLYATANTPLMIIGNAVYSIDSDCISATFATSGSSGGGNTTRNSGGGTDDRSSKRNSGGGSDDRSTVRNSGGGTDNLSNASNTRNSGGGTDDRSNASNTRSAGGGSVQKTVPRVSGGGNISFTCEVTTSNKVTIYIPAFRKSETIRIYYNNAFVDKKYYKIKTQ